MRHDNTAYFTWRSFLVRFSLFQPVISQGIFVLFIYSFVLSTCLKVWNAASSLAEKKRGRASHAGLPPPTDLPPPRYQELEVDDELSSDWRERPQAAEKDLKEAELIQLKEDFRRQLSQEDQRVPLATMHVWIAFFGLVVVVAVGLIPPFYSVVAWLSLMPSASILIIIIKASFPVIKCLEDFNRGLIKPLTGWMKNINDIMNPQGTFIEAFNIYDIIRVHRLMGPSCLIDEKFRMDAGRAQVDFGARDCGLITMTYGFSLFFLIIAIAPSFCLGVWLTLPVLSGSLPWYEARNLIWSYYLGNWQSFLDRLSCIQSMSCDFDWPEWLNPMALIDFFLDDPIKTITNVIEHILGLFVFLRLDLSYLLDGWKALQQLNSVISFLKPLATGLMKLWFTLTLCLREHAKLDLVLFGECLPGDAEIAKAKKMAKLQQDMTKGTATIKGLRDKGYTAADLKLGRFTAQDLATAFSLKELMQLGSPELGYSATELRLAGFTAPQLVDTEEVLNVIRFDIITLRDAGYGADDLKAAGFAADKMRDANFAADKLLSAGYTVGEMKKAGFTCSDFHSAGAGAAQFSLHDHFSARDLHKAGFGFNELRACHFTVRELHRECNATAAQLRGAGFEAVSELKSVFGVQELIQANFTIAELRAGQLQARQLKAAGVKDIKELLEGGFTVADVRQVFDLNEVISQGFTPLQLKRDFGFTLLELFNVLTASQLREAGFTASELVGTVPIEQLKQIFTLQELREHLRTLTQRKEAGYTIAMMIGDGHTLEQLRTEKQANGRWLWSLAEFRREGYKAPWICERSSNAGHKWGRALLPLFESVDKCRECKLKRSGEGKQIEGRDPKDADTEHS